MLCYHSAFSVLINILDIAGDDRLFICCELISFLWTGVCSPRAGFGVSQVPLGSRRSTRKHAFIRNLRLYWWLANNRIKMITKAGVSITYLQPYLFIFSGSIPRVFQRQNPHLGICSGRRKVHAKWTNVKWRVFAVPLFGDTFSTCHQSRFILTYLFISMKYRSLQASFWQFTSFNFSNLPISPSSRFEQVYLSNFRTLHKVHRQKWRIRVQLQKSWWLAEAAPWVPQQPYISFALGTLPRISQCLMSIPFLRLNRQDMILTKLWASGYAMGQICNFRSRLLTCGKTIHCSSPSFTMSAWWVKKKIVILRCNNSILTTFSDWRLVIWRRYCKSSKALPINHRREHWVRENELVARKRRWYTWKGTSLYKRANKGKLHLSTIEGGND